MSLRLRDYMSMPDPSTLFTDAPDMLQDQQLAKQGSGLRVTIKATHSGYLLNGRVYPGKGVKNGTGTWLSPPTSRSPW